MPFSSGIRRKLPALTARFPESPGVYIMKSSRGEPIYIGKAVNLKNRIRSYFSDTGNGRAQIPFMLDLLADIDWIATGTESEALILEANLVRRYKPRYNIDLRDDKHYPYLKVTAGEPFPRLLVARRVENDGARYFGPYTEAASMRRLAAFAQRIFKLCDRAKAPPLRPGKETRPCINYAMQRCSGACAGKITPSEYGKQIDQLLRFLSGRRSGLCADLSDRMEKASSNLKFEEAGRLRDQIRLIREASRLQRVDLKIPSVNCDAFGFAEGDRLCCLAVLVFREGLLIGSHRFTFARELWELPAAGRECVILQFYCDGNREPPQELLLPKKTGIDPLLLQQSLNDRCSNRTTVRTPGEGVKHLLVVMAERNARLQLAQDCSTGGSDDTAELGNVLGLPRRPRLIEAFDISNLGGSFSVAGMVRFNNGVPEKRGYRRFKIRTAAGPDDFSMILEAVSRRLARLQAEQKPFPDLLFIDGGKGQLHAARKALRSFSNPPALAALAKKEELLYSSFRREAVRLPPAHPARRLAERMRDEAHRFALAFHRRLRGKQFSHSLLEEVPGIGPAKAAMLLKTFGSVKRLRETVPEDIAKLKGLTPASARALKETLEKLR